MGTQSTKTVCSSAAAVAALVACSAAYAGVLVVPNGNASANGNTEQFAVLGNGQAFDFVFQWDFPASQLAGLSGQTIDAIGFRLPAGAAPVAAGLVIPSWDLVLSGSNFPIASLSSTPADNIASNAVTVYDGSLTLPAFNTVAGGPNPFAFIDFTTPFVYTGGDLLLTLIEPNNLDIAVDANHPDSNGTTVLCPASSSPNCSGYGGVGFFNYPITAFQSVPSTVPEPSTWAMMLVGFAGLGYVGYRASRKTVGLAG